MIFSLRRGRLSTSLVPRARNPAVAPFRALFSTQPLSPGDDEPGIADSSISSQQKHPERGQEPLPLDGEWAGCKRSFMVRVI